LRNAPDGTAAEQYGTRIQIPNLDPFFDAAARAMNMPRVKILSAPGFYFREAIIRMGRKHMIDEPLHTGRSLRARKTDSCPTCGRKTEADQVTSAASLSGLEWWTTETAFASYFLSAVAHLCYMIVGARISWEN